jgi:hypothetical protein
MCIRMLTGELHEEAATEGDGGVVICLIRMDSLFVVGSFLLANRISVTPRS